MRKDEKLIGAAAERKAILRKVRRELKEAGERGPLVNWLTRIEAWILDRDRRYSKRKGGLGK